MNDAPHSPDSLDLAVLARQLGRSGPDQLHPVSRIMVRCPWDLPAVVEDLPYDRQGRPFPTLFYLTCPTAVAAVHRLESAGGVETMAATLAASQDLRASLRAADAYERRRRRELARAQHTAADTARAAPETGVGAAANAGAESMKAGTAPAEPRDGGASLDTGVAGRRCGIEHAGGSRVAGRDVDEGAGLKCLHAHVAHALARPGYQLGELIVAAAGGREVLWCDDARCLRDARSGRGAATSDGSGEDALRVAVVDLGTNTCRLLLAEVGPEWCGPVRQRARTTTVVRLGEGVDAYRRLAPAAVRRTRACLEGYADRIDAFSPDIRGLIATSVLRDAEDGDAFLADIERDLGLPWRILSGTEEGATTFRGATCGVGDLSGTVLVLDIGGGSTELVAGAAAARSDGPCFGRSLDLGVVRLTERFFCHDPPTAREWSAAVRLVRRELRAAVPRGIRQGVDQVIGVAGTVATLIAHKLRLREYRADVVDGQPLHRWEIERAIALFKTLPSAQRGRLPGIQKGREDVILAGALILREVCRLLAVPGVVYTEADILHGAALRLADEEHTRHGRRTNGGREQADRSRARAADGS